MTGKTQLKYNKKPECWEQMDSCKMSDENDSHSDKFIMLSSCNSKGIGKNAEQSCDKHRKYPLFAMKEVKMC